MPQDFDSILQAQTDEALPEIAAALWDLLQATEEALS